MQEADAPQGKDRLARVSVPALGTRGCSASVCSWNSHHLPLAAFCLLEQDAFPLGPFLLTAETRVRVTFSLP